MYLGTFIHVSIHSQRARIFENVLCSACLFPSPALAWLLQHKRCPDTSFFHMLVLFPAEPINARTTHASAPARSRYIGAAGYWE